MSATKLFRYNLQMSTDHSIGIQRAIDSALAAKEAGEVPIGAALLLPCGKWIESGNLRETDHDPTGHAETRVIREAARQIQNWRLLESTLYVMIEPCLLCSGAIYLSRIPRVVYGAPNPKGGALKFCEENRKKLGLNHSIEVIEGINKDKCATLLRDFFARKRQT